MPEGVGRYEHTDPNGRRDWGKGSEESPRLEIGSLGTAWLDHVIAVPGTVETELLEQPPSINSLGPRHVLVGADPEADGPGHGSVARRGQVRVTGVSQRA